MTKTADQSLVDRTQARPAASETGSNPICILLCIDDKYLPQAGVALFSLLERNPDPSFDVLVASFRRDHALSASVFRAALERHDRCNITFIDLDDTLFADLPVTEHFSKSIYTRMLVGRFVEKHRRVLYIDADTLICGDIGPLWETVLDDAVLAAVRDPFNCCLADIGFDAADSYFNSGVLLIDMARWREEDCESRLLAHLHVHRSSPWMDQDALNLVLRGRIKFVGIEWNYQPRCADVPAAFLGLKAAQYRRWRAAPRIIHFTTSIKPWNEPHRIHYSNRYFAAAHRAGLGPFFCRPRLNSAADVATAFTTLLRWHFPHAFRWVRRLLKPEAAEAMYRADPSGRRPKRTAVVFPSRPV